MGMMIDGTWRKGKVYSQSKGWIWRNLLQGEPDAVGFLMLSLKTRGTAALKYPRAVMIIWSPLSTVSSLGEGNGSARLEAFQSNVE